MSDERDRTVVELAIQAAGTADGKWAERVTALVPRVAALFREPHDETDPNSLINTARKVAEAHVFAAEYRGHELDDEGRDGNRPTQRIFVKVYDEKGQDRSDHLDADGCQTIRTEPMWSASGRAMRRILESMEHGQRAVFYRYTEQIDRTRKQGLLVHLEPLRASGGNRTRPPAERVPPPDSASAGRQDSGGAPAAPPESASDDAQIIELERRYEAITGVWRVRLAKRAHDELGVSSVLLPPADKVDDVLTLMDQIEQEREGA